MSEKWMTVQPGGYLKKFGSHRFFVSTPAEAIKAMMMQVPGFEKAFTAADKRGVKFQVITDKRTITDCEELKMGSPNLIRLMPRYAGSKNGAIAMLAVAAIIAVTIATGGVGGFLVAGTTSGFVATSVAVSLALGGITQMLTPQPRGLKNTADVENKPSYAFGGPVNTTAQGVPVPVYYGLREVGGAVVSASITSEDQK